MVVDAVAVAAAAAAAVAASDTSSIDSNGVAFVMDTFCGSVVAVEGAPPTTEFRGSDGENTALGAASCRCR